MRERGRGEYRGGTPFDISVKYAKKIQAVAFVTALRRGKKKGFCRGRKKETRQYITVMEKGRVRNYKC